MGKKLVDNVRKELKPLIVEAKNMASDAINQIEQVRTTVNANGEKIAEIESTQQEHSKVLGLLSEGCQSTNNSVKSVSEAIKLLDRRVCHIESRPTGSKSRPREYNVPGDLPRKKNTRNSSVSREATVDDWYENE